MVQGNEKRCSVCGKTSKFYRKIPLQYNRSEKGLVCASCYSKTSSYQELQKFRLINTALQLQNQKSKTSEVRKLSIHNLKTVRHGRNSEIVFIR